MSTKSTIVYDDDFHFYHELGDERNVYLELRGTHFEAGYNRVMVPIPIHIWEVIRRFGGVDLSLADKSDEEMQALVEAEIDERIARYEQSRGTNTIASLRYFGADRPREEQIAEAIEENHASRREQREIQAAIRELEEKNRPRTPHKP
jgi:hypothetical protein